MKLELNSNLSNLWMHMDDALGEISFLLEARLHDRLWIDLWYIQFDSLRGASLKDSLEVQEPF